MVYPRVCGGTLMTGMGCPDGCGLSPRVRGNPTTARAVWASPRSIPACAGEPGRWCTRWGLRRVYPRVCGGTYPALPPPPPPAALSPRVRGNLCTPPTASPFAGSIPACAGEPPPDPGRGAGRGVYPRVCGGTSTRSWAWRRQRGLSPRVRGNLSRKCRACPRMRSIPACAGEPS